MRKLLIFAMVLLILVVACDEEPQGAVFPDYSSPARTFWTFTECFNRFTEVGIIKTLNDTLTDEFTFYFDPNDENVPVSLDKTAFCDACQNMFEQAYGINFEFTNIGSPGEGETEYSATIEIEFLLMIDETSGYQATGDIEVGFLQTGDGWKIGEIRDHTLLNNMTIGETSWGGIIALFL
jgi:hypothetical protein